MGSQSDWPYMMPCTDTLEKLQIPFEYGVVSAHRTPGRMVSYGQTATNRGLKIIIACAGGSAHLPGMMASETKLPVLGVSPKKTDQAAISSMIEMPEGIPLAYLGGGSEAYRNAGAVNAALFAARTLALFDTNLAKRLNEYQEKLSDSVPFTCY
jgi:5-(carboxyamino)imidazole ribonucleotide mutase